MNQNFESLSQQIDLARSLGIAALTGFDAFIALQFDQAQALSTRSTAQAKITLSESSDVHDMAVMPELMNHWVANANILMQDTIISSVEHQMEVFRLLQLQAAEVRDVIVESMHQQRIPMDQISNQKQRTNQKSALQQMKVA